MFCALALLGTAIEQIGLGVRHWQRTEVGEAEEGFGAGQKGSSAMPHKKNPVLSENLCGLARLLSALTDDELEALTAAHRRALVALLYGGADPDSIGALAALRLAALRWFQTLAASGPLLLVLDEVQWLDDASADVLWFVSRRFDRLRIQMAAAEQVAHDGQPLGRQLCPPGTLEIRLDPLGRPNVTHYVRRRR